MSHGQAGYQPGQQYPPNMGHQLQSRPYQSHQQSRPPMDQLTFGLKNMGMGPQDSGMLQGQHHGGGLQGQHHGGGLQGQHHGGGLQGQHHGGGQPNNGMRMQGVFHPTDTKRGANQGKPVSQTDFLNMLGLGVQPVGSQRPAQNNLASAVPMPPLSQPSAFSRMPPQPPPTQPILQHPGSTNLSVAASEFVPGFRKPEKTIVLYTPANFKRKSKAEDEMAINDVKRKLIQLYTSPQDVESVMETAVETIKSWTMSANTYHQIVEDVFEFSVDEQNHPNFHSIGSKILNYLTLKVPPFPCSPPIAFFDTVVHKCCREFDNCMRLDHRLQQAQDRIKNIALMIAELFHTIKEGELRVFLFAEQVTSLCLLLVQIRTVFAFETVAKIFLVCGKDLKVLVDDIRFNCIMQHLRNSTKFDLDSKTRSMVENVLLLNDGGWKIREEEQRTSNSASRSWSGRDDCQPVMNPGEWDEYATDDYDEEWLTQMLKFEEEDDFSDVEEDFKKFMEEAQKYNN